MDRYAKTLLTKVGHIFILYHPLRERKYVSFTKAKIWVLEICPKIASHATFFTFLFISQERDCLGKIYLITSDQQGCRNLGQDQSEKFWLLARREFLLQARYALLISSPNFQNTLDFFFESHLHIYFLGAIFVRSQKFQVCNRPFINEKLQGIGQGKLYEPKTLEENNKITASIQKTIY